MQPVSTTPPLTPSAQPSLVRYAHAVEAVGGADMVAALLPVLAQTLRQDALRLDAACADAQWVAAVAVLHGLKGVLPLFCAPEMAQRIIDLEAVCKAGAGDAARAAWPVLRADMLDLHEEVRVIIEKAA